MDGAMLNRPRIGFIALLLACVCGLVSAQTTRRQDLSSLDSVVAVVNAEVITRQELSRQIDLVRRQLESRKIEVPPAEVLASQVLERMILERAQLQTARDGGIRVDDAQLERAITGIAAFAN